MKPTQERVRAVIIKDGDLILIRMKHETIGEYWILPGGGVEKGETRIAALRRECMEEMGVEVSVSDEIGHYELDEPDMVQSCYLYTAHVVKGTPGVGVGPEYSKGPDFVFEVQLIPLSEVKVKTILPKESKDILMAKIL